MSMWYIYLLEKVGDFRHLFIAGSLGCAAIATIVILAGLSENWFDEKAVLKLVKSLGIGLLIIFLIGFSFPSTKTLIAMVGVNYLSQIDGIEKLPPIVVKVLNKLAEDYLEESKK